MFSEKNKQYFFSFSTTMYLVNSSLKLLQTSNSIYNVFIYAGMHKSFWISAKSIVFQKDLKEITHMAKGHHDTSHVTLIAHSTHDEANHVRHLTSPGKNTVVLSKTCRYSTASHMCATLEKRRRRCEDENFLCTPSRLSIKPV